VEAKCSSQGPPQRVLGPVFNPSWFCSDSTTVRRMTNGGVNVRPQTPLLTAFALFVYADVMTHISGTPNRGFQEGTGTRAVLDYPYGVLCTADAGNNRIRCVHTATNEVSTVVSSSLASTTDGKAIVSPHFLTFDPTAAIPGSVIYVSSHRQLHRLSLGISMLCCVALCCVCRKLVTVVLSSVKQVMQFMLASAAS
jgi:hypothetical protein